jgi:hypothetical protein
LKGIDDEEIDDDDDEKGHEKLLLLLLFQTLKVYHNDLAILKTTISLVNYLFCVLICIYIKWFTREVLTSVGQLSSLAG